MLEQEYFFIFSGDGGSLAHSELDALLESDDISYSIITKSERFVLIRTGCAVDWKIVVDRAAYATDICLHIASVETIQLKDVGNSVLELDGMQEIETFRVDCINLGGAEPSVDIEKRIAEAIQNTRPKFKVSMEEPDAVLVAAQRGGITSIGFSLARKSHPRWEKRRPKTRPFFYSAALFPKFSRALVNLSRAKKGEHFLDPFCGSGSLLIEASLMGLDAIGIDISSDLCQGALRNLRTLDSPGSVITGDARKIPLRSVGGVATDIPYGKIASISGSDQKKLVEEFLQSLHNILEEGKYLIVVHPKQLAFSSEGYARMNRHEIRVHRSLTRIVSEYKRT